MYTDIYTYIYVIMKTMCPPGYHHNGFVATQRFIGTSNVEPYIMCPSRELPQSHCGDNREGTLFS